MRKLEIRSAAHALRKALILTTFVLGAWSVPEAPVIAADDVPDPTQVKDIPTFVACLNKIKTKGSAADAVQCIPPGCKVTLTMSGASTQAACTLGTCQLPRVIFNCPDPTNKAKNKKRLRPSFLLCPIDSKGRPFKDFGTDRIEVGEDGDGVDIDLEGKSPGSMRMADVPAPANTDFTALTVDKVVSQPGGERDKGCTMCHGADGTNSKPINPFGTRTFSRPDKYGHKIEIGRYVMDTNEADKKIPAEGQLLTNTDGKTPLKANPQTGVANEMLQDLKAQTLRTVCDCIMNNKKTIATQAANPNIAKTIGRDNPPDGSTGENTELDTDLLLNLCTKLRDYRENKACGKSDPDPALVCSGLSGGGKFLIGTGVSMLRFHFSGNAYIFGPNSLSFIDADGSVSAYNYATRTLIDEGQLSALNVMTLPNGDLVVTGSGSALVNGIPTNILLKVTRTNGALTFGMYNVDASMALLAGGDEEPGRAALDFNPNAP
jgi:hypothetical protein